MERKDWNRIGIAAAVVLVPGGFLLGAVIAARRLRAGAVTCTEAEEPAEPGDETPPHR